MLQLFKKLSIGTAQRALRLGWRSTLTGLAAAISTALIACQKKNPDGAAGLSRFFSKLLADAWYNLQVQSRAAFAAVEGWQQQRARNRSPKQKLAAPDIASSKYEPHINKREDSSHLKDQPLKASPQKATTYVPPIARFAEACQETQSGAPVFQGSSTSSGADHAAGQ